MADPTLPEVTPAADGGDAAGRLAARVQAWQHRNPLARRISASEVAGLGAIALPYGPGAGGQMQALFHQPNLLPGLSHRALVAFADRHAVAHRPGPPDWPLRAIERSDASTEAPPETRYLLTAAINEAQAGRAQPRRVLIAPESPAIWGQRPLSRPRLAGALAVLLLAAALGAIGLKAVLQRPDVPAVTAPAAASVPAAVASPVASAVPPVAAPASAPALAPAAQPASTPAVAIASAEHASAAAPVPAPISGTHYALVSAPVKKREAAEATLERVRKVLGPAIGRLQAQVMPSPEGFVVTIWPLPTEPDAERLAEVLARRGVPMKWMEF